MALREIDKQLIAESLASFSSQQKYKQVPFSRIIPWLSVIRGCVLVPRASEQTTATIKTLISSPTFDANDAATCFNLLRVDLLPENSNVTISVIRCAARDNKSGVVCDKQAMEPGCDECAGKQYFAKTDNNTVWMADELFRAPYVNGGAEFLTVGDVTVHSLTEFVIYHEFSHLLQEKKSESFSSVTALYTEAKTLVPQEIWNEGRVLFPDNDALEFASNSFAYENARSDRKQRAVCQ